MLQQDLQKHKEEMYTVFHGSLENPKSIGTNNLIKEYAKLVTCPKDIIKNYPYLNKVQQNETQKTNAQNETIKQEYEGIYNLITSTPIDINEIVKKSKINIKEVMQKLTMLELEQKIKKISGTKYIKI